MNNRQPFLFQTCGLAASAISFILIGCAGNPPTEELSLAENAVTQAESSNAQEHAPRELHSANQKLDAARAATREGHYEEARLLAQKAEIDAQLAEKKAQSTKAHQSVEELHTEIRELHDELDR